MKAYFASAVAAKAVVEPVLRARGLDTALREGRRAMWFAYQDVVVIDRDPLPPGPSFILAAGDTLRTGELVSLRVTRRECPAPPECCTASADVETLWHRYEGYQRGREHWLAMAYSCLSVLEWRASRHPRRGDVRAGAELLYGIEREVLRKLGGLTADLGGETTARKVGTRSLHRVPTHRRSPGVRPRSNWSSVGWASMRLIPQHPGPRAARGTCRHCEAGGDMARKRLSCPARNGAS
jgi:hypothetical protein